MKKIASKINGNALATIAGLLVAIGNAWATIEWENFEFTKGNIAKLTVSAMIAIGGYVSTINIKK